jgi:predicted ATP-grasp superfamily ATP-dependent carboligase
VNIDLKKTLVYVTRDIERAIGIEPVTHGGAGYFIVSNDTPQGRDLRERYAGNIFLVENNGVLLDTYDLLARPEVAEMIAKHSADIIVFQNTPRIERLCIEKRWKLLNPSAALSKRVEEKISQIAFLAEDASLLPSHNVILTKEARFIGKKFVLQFNHGHTGEGTFIIDSADALEAIQQKFPNRECRVADFIEGPVFTVNAIVTNNGTIVGNPSYQITGIAPFTNLPFSTVGNDWDLPRESQYEKASIDIMGMAQTVGERLGLAGWKGLFGIDMAFDENTQKPYLLEINARQPASAVFESKLQTISPIADGITPTVFEAHIAALIGQQTPDTCVSPISGAQIVKRVTAKTFSIDAETLYAKKLTVMKYANTEMNKDLFRIQSSAGIMKSHNEFNDLGTSISACIR